MYVIRSGRSVSGQRAEHERDSEHLNAIKILKKKKENMIDNKYKSEIIYHKESTVSTRHFQITS